MLNMNDKKTKKIISTVIVAILVVAMILPTLLSVIRF